MGIYVRYQRRFIKFTYSAPIPTCGSALVLWFDCLGEVPIDENTACIVWSTLVDNHDVPRADIAMKNASLIGGLMG